MKSNKVKALSFTLLLALAFACLLPHIALAESGSLAAGTTIDTFQIKNQANAQVKYSVTSNGKWLWKSSGTTSAVKKGGQVKRFRLKVASNLPGSVQYQVYVSNEGWQGVKSNGSIAGKKNKKIEALRIALTGKLAASYDVRYRIMTSKGKWQAWKTNGATAGKTGLRIRGIQVVLVKRSSVRSSDGIGIVGVRYKVKTQGSSKWQAWKANNATAGKTGSGKRVRSIAIASDAGVFGGGLQYRTLLANGKWTGWKRNGQEIESKARIAAIQVRLTGALSSRYDVLYRTYSKKDGWKPYVRNGATSRPAKGKQIEAIRIKLATKPHPNGWFKEKSGWRYYEKGVGMSYRQKLRLTEDYRAEFAHGRKGTEYQKYIVLHDTAMDSDAQDVIDYWDGNNSGVAAHFIVNKNGSIMQCVPLDSIAHHAGFGNTGHNRQYGVEDESRDDKVGTVGIGNWARDYGMNSYSVGIEMVHVGGSGGYPEAQLNALDNLIAYIDAYYGKKSPIIDHKAWRTGNSDTSREFAAYLANYQDHRTHLAA